MKIIENTLASLIDLRNKDAKIKTITALLVDNLMLSCGKWFRKKSWQSVILSLTVIRVFKDTKIKSSMHPSVI